MINDIKLTSAMKNSLLNHQQIKDLTATVEKRLATGKKVNDILDGPVEYFKAKGLYDKADGLLRRKDDIDQAISTLKATQHGITNGRMIIEQVKGLAEEARTASAAQRAILAMQANKLLAEYDDLIYDTNKDGVNLLINESLYVNFDNSGTDYYLLNNSFRVDTMSYAQFEVVEYSDAGQSAIIGNYNGSDNYWIGLNGNEPVFRWASGPAFAPTGLNLTTLSNFTLRFDVVGPNVTATITASDGTQLYQDTQAHGGLQNTVADMFGGTAQFTSVARAFNGVLSEIDIDGDVWEMNPLPTTLTSSNGNTANQISPNPADMIYNGNATSDFATSLNIELSDDTSHTIDSVDIRTQQIGLFGYTFSSTGAIEQSIADLDAALNRIDTTAASFATDFALLQTRLELTEDLINTHEEAGDKLTLADLEEESANRLALETREQLSIFSMTNSNRSIQNLIDILFGGGS